MTKRAICIEDFQFGSLQYKKGQIFNVTEETELFFQEHNMNFKFYNSISFPKVLASIFSAITTEQINIKAYTKFLNVLLRGEGSFKGLSRNPRLFAILVSMVEEVKTEIGWVNKHQSK